jgi:hypothetical protein
MDPYSLYNREVGTFFEARKAQKLRQLEDICCQREVV